MKGIAVHQIILIVLGIIVLGVIGYLIYTQFLSGKGQITFENCRSRAVTFCGMCKLSGTYTRCVVTYVDATTANSCRKLLSGYLNTSCDAGVEENQICVDCSSLLGGER